MHIHVWVGARVLYIPTCPDSRLLFSTVILIFSVVVNDLRYIRERRRVHADIISIFNAIMRTLAVIKKIHEYLNSVVDLVLHSALKCSPLGYKYANNSLLASEVNPTMVSTVRFYDRNELYGSPDVRNCRMPNYLGWEFFVISIIRIN